MGSRLHPGSSHGRAHDGPIVGRSVELARLRGLVDPVPVSSRSLVLLGDAGMGKTILLADAANRAAFGGMRIVSATGRQSEAALAFSSLQQLLRPLFDDLAALPEHLREALAGALGLATQPRLPDRLLIGTAVLRLLAAAAERTPLLLVCDDAHWFDRSSLAALSFVCDRLLTERVVVLVGARGTLPPHGFDRVAAELHLDPLSDHDAKELLDEQPVVPRGRARAEVLRQAEGNPMALVELARVVAEDPGVVRRWATEPIPIGGRLAQIIVDQVQTLSAKTQDALLFASVTDRSGPSVTRTCLELFGPGALAPAEQLGLVELNRDGFRFTHPIIRSAVYHSASFARRAWAHNKLAGILQDQPDRRAWHLAAALLTPDDTVAALLEETANEARRRGGAVPAALAMERAAQLSRAPDEQARRFIAAASLAVSSGQSDWVERLATQALAVTDEPRLRLAARHAMGWALAWTNRHAEALSALLSVAEDAAATDPPMGWDALSTAATVVYQSDAPGGHEAVIRVLAVLEQQTTTDLADDEADRIDVIRLWIRSAIDPIGYAPEAARLLGPFAGSDLDTATQAGLGAAAWMVDETEFAVRSLHSSLERLRGPGLRGASGAVMSVLAFAYLERGRWDDALATAAEAMDLAIAHEMDIVAASAHVTAATVLALRGEVGAARARASAALGNVRIGESPAVQARARHALGLAELADGDSLAAYSYLRGLFPDGRPLHFHVSYLGIADLALAATRAGQRDEARDILAEVVAGLPKVPSPRVAQLVARASGLLADDASADEHFTIGLADPAGQRWPFERAQLQLDYAEWLRRQRRINEAKAQLLSANETFEWLSAEPWARRAIAELRAAGVPAGVGDSALAKLTPQQVEIVQLASEGLTNRQIADRMFLSARTVSSHLYRSYPKLGVTDRRQLRDALERIRASEREAGAP
ncbi:LuxR family transcriptional regulator [Dactylosporangium darangshiense]|uniref:LuxR family transcriptional regulator n=2 Tax=Dactylosporangium darangshiense TaxID=579108 RepID=A0ABP8DUW4_9ACTN